MKRYNRDDFIKDLESIEIEVIRKYEPSKESVVEYCNIEASFDIETTSTYINEDKFAFMYVWQFGIKNEDYIYYGRTWEEFIELIETVSCELELSNERILIVYVQFLSFEFQFFRKLFNWENVFAVDERKPIKALCDYGIEFRDSYILANYSLEKIADNLTKHSVKKLIGNLDYSLIRNSKTYLTEKELEYCKNDIVILLYYINEQIEQYGDITKIPLTNTGRVRKYVRDKCLHYKRSHKKEGGGKVRRYRELMQECSLTLPVYEMLQRAFMGGFTHASMKYSGVLLKNVASIDFTSSYPYVMISEQFPMGKPKKENVEDFEKLLADKSKGLLFDCALINVFSDRIYETYLSESKCRNIKNGIINNGRIYSADYLETTLTDIDYYIIKQCYSDDLEVVVTQIYSFYMSYLPQKIIESILDLYEGKTTLKGVEGYETEYLNKKGMLNSVYGMSVTNIIRDDITYTDKWDIIHDVSRETMEEKIEKHNNSKNRFLYYPWGIWTTAYARKNLWEGIIEINEDYVYADTDSIKFINYEDHKTWIDSYNKQCEEKLMKMCKYTKIDFNRCKPKTNKGVEKLIGVFDFEGIYPLFKTIGAKRYMYTDENNKLHITIAGLSKQNGVGYLLDKYSTIEEIFDNFDDELYIPAYATGKNTHTYIDSEMTGKITDYTGLTEEITSLSGVHLEQCEFTLSISKQYAKFLNDLKQGYLYRGMRYR